MEHSRLHSCTLANRVGEPIAIVGIGCRFPGGASSLSAYWNLLISGRDAIVPVPEDRWDVRRFYDPDPKKPGKMYVRAGGFIKEKLDEFDALFFGISPREAMCMDPQQRLLMEVAWEAVEDAGLVPDRLAGSDTGVYIGGFTLDGKLNQMNAMNRDMIGPHTALGSTMTILSNRISYFFDFRGPSVTVDTACSSSLVALHHACQAIWNRECSLALAGGASIMLRPEYPLAMCKGQFLSPDGRCKSFDERADGYGRGEGAGIVILKPLSAALRDRDPIYALVRGTGVNQDGRTDGITVPNPESQQALIRRVIAQTGVDPKHVRYVEAHGTGTPVGDPIEASALGAVFGRGRPPENACVVGSVKSSIGHLEAASGVAGLIKLCLCLQHRKIPPLANLETPNPQIPFDELGIRLPTTLEPMPNGDGPVLVGINSFGYGGTNAHAILEAAPKPKTPLRVADTQSCKAAYLLPLSARSPEALKTLAREYMELLCGSRPPSLHDVCYSASVRRQHHEHRLALTAPSSEALAAHLLTFVEHSRGEHIATGTTTSNSSTAPVFVFSGMGPQWWAMGRQLLQEEPVFRDAAERCDAIFRQLAGWSILEEMTTDELHSRIGETQIAQPANFLLQVALVRLWRSWGVEPAAVVGHSVGEVTSAYVAGVLALEDAVAVSYHRSRIQKKAAGKGKMLAIGLPESEARQLVSDHEDVSIAAANSPSAVTLAGSDQALQAIAASAEAQGIFNRFLQVEVAYHSPYMDPLEDEVLASLEDLQTQAPALPLYSTVTGQLVDTASYDAKYWFRNIRQPVFFAKAMQSLIGDGYRTFLEVGPHPVLSTSMKECLLRQGVQGNVIGTLRRKQPERQTMLEGLGTLYTCGCNVDWQRLYSEGGLYVRLPSYPWQRQTYWNESEDALIDRVGQEEHPVLGQDLAGPRRTWERKLNGNYLPYLADHRVEQLVVLPGAAYVEAALAMHQAVHGTDEAVLRDVEFNQALLIDDGDEPVVRFYYDDRSEEYTVYSRTRDDRSNWQLHSSGRLSTASIRRPEPKPIEQIQQRCDQTVDAETLYPQLAARGLHYGTYFQVIRRVWRRAGEVLAQIEPHDDLTKDAAEYRLHPTLLDGCFQSLIAALDADEADGDAQVYIPVHIDQIRFYSSPNGQLWSHGELTHRAPERIEGNIVVCDESGHVLVEVRGLVCQAMAASDNKLPLDQWLYRYSWVESEPPAPTETTGRWLLMVDEGDVGELLAKHLQAMGAEEVIRVAADGDFRKDDETHFRIRRTADDMRKLFAAVDVGQCRGVVYLWGLDAAANGDPMGSVSCNSALQLVQALEHSSSSLEQPRVFVLTQGMKEDRLEEQALLQAPLVGLTRVAFNEHPDRRYSVVDIADSLHDDDMRRLACELLSNSAEDDVALRGEQRFVHRVLPVVASELDEEPADVVIAAPGDSFEIEGEITGEVEHVRFRQTMRRDPGAGEIEIEINAAGIDTELAAELAPSRRHPRGPHSGELRIPVSGVITSIGPAVDRWRCGDEVVAVVDGPLSSHAIGATESLCVAPKPRLLSHREAAALPALYVPACYALEHVARLQPDETVLILGSADSRVMAAVQAALSIGARVIVSCEDCKLDQWLWNCGVELVSGAALDRADQVHALTGGRGVDVLMNYLPGRFDPDRMLASFGRLLFMHTNDTGDAWSVPGRSLRRNWTLSAVDLNRMIHQRPGLYRKLVVEVCARLGGDLQPIPSESFSVTKLTEALAAMADAETPRATSISMQESVPLLPLRQEKAIVQADGSYLISGGFGGFGLQIARWLVQHGAQHLVLMGRRGAATPESQQAVRELEQAGAEVKVVAADIASQPQVAEMMADIASSMPPLRGVMHAAAVLDDDLLVALNEERLINVLKPKALGAWNLHVCTKDAPLDFFVLFSSVSALIGNGRQGNYVAANVFLDTLAHYRRGLGLPATSVNWGAIGSVGMAADDKVEQHLAQMGLKTFTGTKAAEALGHVMRWNPIQVGVMDVDWNQWRQRFPLVAASPRFTDVVTGAASHEDQAAQETLRATLLAIDRQQRQEVFALLFAEQVAHTLRLPAEQIDVNQQLTNLGMDSLLAVELQIAVHVNFGVELSTLEFMKGKTILQLSELMLQKMDLDDHAATQTDVVDSESSQASLVSAEEVDSLSELDLEKLLNSLTSIGVVA